MPRPYSLELRERVLAAARDERLSVPVLARRFAVSASTVARWLRRARATGTVAPKPRGGGRVATVDTAGAAILRELVAASADGTLVAIGAQYHARTGVRLSRPALGRALTKLGLQRHGRR